MFHSVVIGDIVVILNVSFLILLILAAYKFFQFDNRNIQFSILLISMVLSIPIFILENLIYLNYNYNLAIVLPAIFWLRISFVMAIFSIFFYVVFLMSVENFPTIPLTYMAIIAGFISGVLAISVNVDLSSKESSIYYNPKYAGLIFLIFYSILIIAGIFGFIYSMFFKSWDRSSEIISKIHYIDLIAICTFVLTPVVFFLLRVQNFGILPENIIMIAPELSFNLHLLLYLRSNTKFGFPIRAVLNSLIIMNIEKELVIGGFTLDDDEDFSKLKGMAILALDDVIGQILSPHTKKMNKFEISYGDSMIIHHGDYLLSASILGKGKKMGKYLLRTFLQYFIVMLENGNGSIEKNTFINLISKELRYYLHKKLPINKEQVFMMEQFN